MAALAYDGRMNEPPTIPDAEAAQESKIQELEAKVASLEKQVAQLEAHNRLLQGENNVLVGANEEMRQRGLDLEKKNAFMRAKLDEQASIRRNIPPGEPLDP